MPHLNRMAGSGAQSFKLAVAGQPGTQGIPAPDPGVPRDRTAQAQMGTARSGDAPNAWYPQLWFQDRLTERPGAGMPLRVYSDNLMPVPAIDPRGVPTMLSMPPSYATLQDPFQQARNIASGSAGGLQWSG
jgi:hypothetical protein